MDFISQNLVGSQEAKYKLALHLQNRKKVKEMYRMKGVQMLDKPELVISDIQEPNIKPQQALIYQTMKSELIKKGYSDFRFLGQGVQGLVLLAKDSKNNIRYAIKGVQIRDPNGNLDKDLSDRVSQEVEILKKCRESPYVVSLLDQFEGQQFSYLVLTECQGTLTQILERNQNKRLNEISAIKYANDIAQGLYYIHSKSCLVNDLKMDNILIDYHGNAVVSDFGLADNLINKSGYAFNQYMGNFLYQAPECFDPSDPFIGKVYHDEYLKLGVTVRQEPSNRGLDLKLASNKHKELNYDDEFKNFVYHKQLKYIIEGLTNFVPKNRMPIKEALIILKGIISFEFQLDEMLIEMIDGNTQQFTSSLKNEIEFIQDLSNKFYPIIKNEQTLNQELKEDDQKRQYEAKIEELQKTNFQLQQRINEQEQTIQDLFSKLEQPQNQIMNQPQIMMIPAMKMNDQSHVIFQEIKNQEKKDELPKEKIQLQINLIEINKNIMKKNLAHKKGCNFIHSLNIFKICLFKRKQITLKIVIINQQSYSFRGLYFYLQLLLNQYIFLIQIVITSPFHKKYQIYLYIQIACKVFITKCSNQLSYTKQHIVINFQNDFDEKINAELTNFHIQNSQ
ncbi:kinase domain protein (macronuclear) [Tetrahymena thermophila SB210]|uniref:Kinase domain protein n=1 Tax=Tetrahymena thermophila (strain SB210) TaxID=312017 RepID=Q23VC4_TETTS|nr:kinase domain protein [Tetrahymena thermophila SB210]EAS00512.2 kinase domain protein [Tetrahymena thermophila SB210]|eukprot:XP_001020757.2 kinase domain protein [Tetrahymena thermophila SB210]